jgi:hypothetical protein
MTMTYWHMTPTCHDGVAAEHCAGEAGRGRHGAVEEHGALLPQTHRETLLTVVAHRGQGAPVGREGQLRDAVPERCMCICHMSYVYRIR